mmetsp:Transcript_101061/g.179330  ORF Transcript_101061/g.179330 Transcript_101061/m.179330 type:complete len:408 (-) Transcript_101061:56-1279(-)
MAPKDEVEEYMLKDLEPIVQAMVKEIIVKLPSSPTDFMIDWLHKKYGLKRQKRTLLEINRDLKKQLEDLKCSSMDTGITEVGRVRFASQPTMPASESEGSDEEDDDDEIDMPPPPPPGAMKARASVSAEAYGAFNRQVTFQPPKYEKNSQQTERLRSILSSSFLFSRLNQKDLDVILLAMKGMQFEAEARIIQEGQDGDCLYIIEEGQPECKKMIGGEEKVVKRCSRGDVFGELALLYNAPRAASVDAGSQPCVAWQLDRATFNHIVKGAAMEQTDRHKAFLKQVSLFELLDDYQCSQIADALKIDQAKKDDFIIRQGEAGDKFYIVEEGELVALKEDDDGQVRNVRELSTGDYFGELAILKNTPRAASVKVVSASAKVLWLDRKAFKKMLGPLEDLMREKSSSYSK